MINDSISFLAMALLVVILFVVLMVMFTGFLADPFCVFGWISWIQWINAFRYGSNVLTIGEFRNITFCLPNRTDLCPLTGDDVLRKLETWLRWI